jgi:RHS repeat-associated protein
MRVKKSNGTLYWYGIGGQLLAESDTSGNVISEYIFFDRTRIARRDVATGNVYYYLADRLGSARVLTNATGGVVEESDYYPFGVERPITDTLDNKYKFTEHERDPESGLDHTHFRQYSCNTGRWLSPDSVRGRPNDPQSWNRYRYAANSPTNAIDPDGKHEWWACDYEPDFVFTGCYCVYCPRNPVNFHTSRDEYYNRMDRPSAFDRTESRLNLAGRNLRVMLAGELTPDCIGTLATLDVAATDVSITLERMRWPKFWGIVST